MDEYIFALFTVVRETYREEMFALTDDNPNAMAWDALNGMRTAHVWTIETLTDIAGRIVWQSARPYPKAPDL